MTGKNFLRDPDAPPFPVRAPGAGGRVANQSALATSRRQPVIIGNQSSLLALIGNHQSLIALMGNQSSLIVMIGNHQSLIALMGNQSSLIALIGNQSSLMAHVEAGGDAGGVIIGNQSWELVITDWQPIITDGARRSRRRCARSHHWQPVMETSHH